LKRRLSPSRRRLARPVDFSRFDDDLRQLHHRLAQCRAFDNVVLNAIAFALQFFAQRSQFADQIIDLARRASGNPTQQGAEIVRSHFIVAIIGLPKDGAAARQFANISFDFRLG